MLGTAQRQPCRSLDYLANRRGFPARLRQELVRATERCKPCVDGLAHLDGHRDVAQRLADNCLCNGQRIANPVLKFVGQNRAVRLGVLFWCNVAHCADKPGAVVKTIDGPAMEFHPADAPVVLIDRPEIDFELAGTVDAKGTLHSGINCSPVIRVDA